MTRRMGALGAAIALSACAHPSASLPPAGEHANTALVAYLNALVEQDCRTATRLTTSTFGQDNGDLCGTIEVRAARIMSIAATPNPHEAVFATLLTTHGGDETLPDGDNVWFFTLRRQSDGEWRVTGAGSGP